MPGSRRAATGGSAPGRYTPGSPRTLLPQTSDRADRTAGTALGVALASVLCMGFALAPVGAALAVRARRMSAPGHRAFRLGAIALVISGLSFAGWSGAIAVRLAAVAWGPEVHTATGRQAMDTSWEEAVAALSRLPGAPASPAPRTLGELDGQAAPWPGGVLDETAATFWVAAGPDGRPWRYVAADLDADGKLAWAALPPGVRHPVPLSDPEVR